MDTLFGDEPVDDDEDDQEEDEDDDGDGSGSESSLPTIRKPSPGGRRRASSGGIIGRLGDKMAGVFGSGGRKGSGSGRGGYGVISGEQ